MKTKKPKLIKSLTELQPVARVTVLMRKLKIGRLKSPSEQRELYAIMYGMSLAENANKNWTRT